MYHMTSEEERESPGGFYTLLHRLMTQGCLIGESGHRDRAEMFKLCVSGSYMR